MESKEKLAELESQQLFKDWRETNKDSFLAHIFRMADQPSVWQFGYYNPDDTITTFVWDGKELEEMPQQEIFKENKQKLTPLDLTKLDISFDDAVSKAKEIQAEKHSKHPIMKTIMILQVLKDVQLYNITFVTQTFHTLNIHIDSTSGEVIEEKLVSLMDIAKVEKGGKKPDYVG